MHTIAEVRSSGRNAVHVGMALLMLALAFLLMSCTTEVERVRPLYVGGATNAPH
jgi:hypothetical protein